MYIGAGIVALLQAIAGGVAIIIGWRFVVSGKVKAWLSKRKKAASETHQVKS